MIEVGARVAFLCCPKAIVVLLLGSGLDNRAAVTLGRVAGAALLALSFACWLARRDGQSRAATGLVAARLLYNLGAVAILASACIAGVALWPAVVLHAVMAVWCIAFLRFNERKKGPAVFEKKPVLIFSPAPRAIRSLT